MKFWNFWFRSLSFVLVFIFGCKQMLGSSTLKDTITVKDLSKETTVILVFGQSNSSNYGQSKYDCKWEVYNWYDGKIVKARDPLKGADGQGGSVWGRLGDKMIESGLASKVLLVPLGIGSTTVADWSKGGIHHGKLLTTLTKLEEQHINIDLIIWHQGESDNFKNTSSSDYIESFEVIRKAIIDYGVIAPIFMSIASYHPNVNSLKNKNLGCDPDIQAAQHALIKNYPDIFAGVNTDKLDKSYYRYDGIHFSVLGLEKNASLWLEVLKHYQDYYNY